MRFNYVLFLIALIFMSCNDNKKMDSADADDMARADSLFQKNSETVMKDIRNWESEKPDYSLYADDFVALETMYGAEKDSTNLQEMMDSDKRILELWDFKLLTDPVMLPGVNSETKKPDGSVRYYGTWRITRPASDSTSERSADVKAYASYDFDENGKINYAQMYADFGGLWNHLMVAKDSMMTK
ncbi:MAG: hypothetical protein R2797_05125 [Gelidibacter sp.]